MKINTLRVALFTLVAVISYNLKAQNIGINTTGAAPNAAAILDLNTGNAGTMGLLPEQVALTATNVAGPVALPPTGLIVYNTATAGVSPTNVTPGYYFNAGTGAAPNWVQLVAGNSNSNNVGGWLLNGNTGTNPANNFVGTTDANALNFRTTNLQRMTILSGGNVGINTAAPGFILEVDGATANNQVAYVQNSNASGFAINGTNSAASGTNNGSGVYGVTSQGYNAVGPVTGYGVVALNNNNAGVGTAIYAAANNLGINFATSLNGCGAILVGAYGGFAYSPYNGGIGIWGENNGTGGLGAYGLAIGATSTGVLGVGDNAAATVLAAGSGGAFDGTAFGAYGFATTGGTGVGVVGAGNNIAIFSTPVNGSGGAFTGAGVGSYGFATTALSGNGVIGLGNNLAGYTTLATGSGGSFTGLNAGAFGEATKVASGTGVVGAGNNTGAGTLGAGSGGAFTGVTYGVYAFSSGAGNPSGSINCANNATGNNVFVDYWNGTNYKILGTAPGTVSCSVLDTKGNYVVMHAPETPEAYYEDYGQGKLVNGKVHIDMDPTYAKNICVNDKHPLRVYIQLEGDCKGVYVTNKTATGFDVVELNGGNSNIEFQYHIIGNMADAVMPSGVTSKFADLRFEPSPKAPESSVSPVTTSPVNQTEGIHTTIPNPQVKTLSGQKAILSNQTTH